MKCREQSRRILRAGYGIGEPHGLENRLTQKWVCEFESHLARQIIVCYTTKKSEHMNKENYIQSVEFLAYHKIVEKLSTIYSIQSNIQCLSKFGTKEVFKFHSLRMVRDSDNSDSGSNICNMTLTLESPVCEVLPHYDICRIDVDAIDPKLYNGDPDLMTVNLKRMVSMFAEEIAFEVFQTHLNYVISKIPSIKVKNDDMLVFEINRASMDIARTTRRSFGNSVLIHNSLVTDKVKEGTNRVEPLHDSYLEDKIVIAHVQRIGERPTATITEYGSLDAGMYFMLRSVKISEFGDVSIEYAIHEDEHSSKYYRVLEIT